jgi:hypothetical protein
MVVLMRCERMHRPVMAVEVQRRKQRVLDRPLQAFTAHALGIERRQNAPRHRVGDHVMDAADIAQAIRDQRGTSRRPNRRGTSQRMRPGRSDRRRSSTATWTPLVAARCITTAG